MENFHTDVRVQMVNEHLIPHARLIVSNFWDTQITLYMFQKSLFLIIFLFSFTFNYLLSLLILLHFLFLLFNFQQDPANETKRSWIWDTLGVFLIFMILASELFTKIISLSSYFSLQCHCWIKHQLRVKEIQEMIIYQRSMWLLEVFSLPVS